MKRLIKYVFIFVSSYVLHAFIMLDLNLFNWNILVRVFVVLLGLFASMLISDD